METDHASQRKISNTTSHNDASLSISNGLPTDSLPGCCGGDSSARRGYLLMGSMLFGAALALTGLSGTAYANEADPGDYPLKLNNLYPDAILFNADKYAPKTLSDLAPNSMLEKLDQAFVDGENALKQLGVNPFVYYWGDLLGNPVGGRKTAYDWTQLLVFGAKIDLDPIGWKGGTVVFSFSDGTGYNVGQAIGNIFTPSQAKSFPTFANNVLYLKQMLMDGNLELRLGRFPSASVFASLPAMGSLPVSGAANGTPTSLFSNIKGWHSTGRPSWAAYAKYLPTKDTYIKAAVLQVNPEAVDVNYHGLYMGIDHNDGTLLLTEWGWTPKFQGASTLTDAPGNGKSVVAPSPVQSTNSVNEYPGIYCFGSYLQNYPQTQFNGQSVYNQYGFYWEAQQMIWRNRTNPNQNLSLWGGVTYSPQTEAAQMPIMGFGGVYYKGLIPMRPRDISMLNFYTGALSGDYAQYKSYQGTTPTQESVVELSYIVQLSDHFQIQPDLQWIIQPGGYSNVPDALVVGFQVAALF